MNKNNTYILILFVIILLIIIIFLLLNKNKETFANSNIPNITLNIQNGLSPITPTGTIVFNIPFQTPPVIFTQIIGGTNSASNGYSVQVFNVSTTGFDYSKNKIINAQNGNYSITKLEQSTLEPFYWIAIN